MTRMSAFRLVLEWMASYALCEMLVVLAAASIIATTWPLVTAIAILEGSLLGVFQGLLLYGRDRRGALAWALATIVGIGIGRLTEYAADVSPLASSLSASDVLVRIAAGTVLGAAIGVGSGSIQAIVLKAARPRFLWALICGGAWAVALPLLLCAGAVMMRFSAAPPMLGILAILSIFGLIGAIVGLIEGVGMAFMRAPRSEAA
jgi:hypothetical protein